MDNDNVAAKVISEEVVDELDKILKGPNDRAFVVCSLSDCNLNQKGQCTIFTLTDVPRMKTGYRCDKYNAGKL